MNTPSKPELVQALKSTAHCLGDIAAEAPRQEGDEALSLNNVRQMALHQLQQLEQVLARIQESA
mgnify:CR=1 FL=1